MCLQAAKIKLVFFPNLYVFVQKKLRDNEQSA